MSPAAFTSGAFGFGALEEPEALAEPLDAVVAAVPPQPANITAAAAATSADDAATRLAIAVRLSKNPAEARRGAGREGHDPARCSRGHEPAMRRRCVRPHLDHICVRPHPTSLSRRRPR